MKGRSKIASEAAKDVTAKAVTVKKACAPKRPKGQLAGNLSQAAPWEPSAKDLEMYERHIRFVSYAEIGKEFGCSHVWALKVCQKVDQWKAQRAIDSIEAIRGQVMSTYAYCVKEAIEKWEETKSDEPDPRFLETAMKGLGEIRKLWAADRVPEKKGGDENKRDDGFAGERVAGKSQVEMLEILVAKISRTMKTTG